jgi:hypothetical protein
MLTPLDPYFWLAYDLYHRPTPSEIAMRLSRANITPEQYRTYRFFFETTLRRFTETFLPGATYSPPDEENHVRWCLQQAQSLINERGGKHRFTENQELCRFLLDFLRREAYHAPEPASLGVMLRIFDLDRLDESGRMNPFLELWALFEKTPVKGRVLRRG